MYSYTKKELNSLSEEEKFNVVDMFPEIIQYIESPSIELQKKAVADNVLHITYINDPSEEVQLKVIEEFWNKDFYERFIRRLGGKTDWFYRELNRLKITKGPMN